MLRMIKHLLASFLKGGIWKEALKSLLYFFILFVVLIYPVDKLISYFAGDYLRSQFTGMFNELVIGGISVFFSLISAYLIIMFARDGYYYKLVEAELGTPVTGSSLSYQIKSVFRVVFILFATIVCTLISFILPIVGLVLLALCFALEVFSFIFEAEKVGVISSFKFAFSNFFSMLILGSFCFFLSLIPGLGLIAYPAAVRAGALYFKDGKSLE